MSASRAGGSRMLGLVCCLSFVAVAGLLPSVQAKDAADRVLWKGKLPRSAADCRVRLEHPLGALQVHRQGRALRLLGDASQWAVTEQASGARHRLEVTALGAGEPPADARPLRLEAPPRCLLELETTAGAIEVSGGIGPLQAQTRTGDIILHVPGEPDLRVDLSTSGDITVDFSVDIDYRRAQEPAKQGAIRVGSAETEVKLSSRQGAVRVLRSR
jgi:hypothetical protein